MTKHADIVLTRVGQTFPVGTSVGLYRVLMANSGVQQPGGEPVATAVVAENESLVFEDVAQDQPVFYAAAKIGSVWRSIQATTSVGEPVTDVVPVIEAVEELEASKITAPAELQSQDTLLYDGGSWARLAKGETGQQIIVRSDGTLQYTDGPEVSAAAWGLAAANSSATNTTKMKAMVEAAHPGTTIRMPKGMTKVGELGEALKEKRNITFTGSNYVTDTTPAGELTYSGIIFTGANVFVDLGTFTTTPANYWQGKSQGFSFERLMVYSEVGNGQAVGSRTPIAIRDNGCGNVTIRDCQFLNFKYGFASPYGSDFTKVEHSKFSLCDVGAYFGPASEQIDMSTLEFDRCQEGLVTDSVQQALISNCSWEDNAVCDYKAEFLETTRFGITAAEGRVGLNNTRITLQNCWHESNAGGTGTVWSTAPIQTYTDRTDKSYPRGIRVIDPFLVAGGAKSETRAFMECTTGKYLKVENLLGEGEAVRYAMNRGEASNLVVKNLRTVDGSTEILPFRNENFNCLTINEFSENSVRGATSGAVVTWINTEGVKHQWLFNGSTVKLRYWTGAEYLERMIFDAQNAIIKLREVELKRSALNVLGFGAAAGVQFPKIAAAAAANETDYIDSTTGVRMFKDSAGTSHALY